MIKEATESQLEILADDTSLPPQVRDQIKIELAQRSKGVYSHQDIHDALFFAFDTMDRALVKWVVIGPVAKDIYRTNLPDFSADGIQGVVMRSQMAESVPGMLENVLGRGNFELTEDMLRFEKNGVPIEIAIFDDDHGVFGNPEKIIYYTEEFYVPNPMKKYESVEENILWSLA